MALPVQRSLSGDGDIFLSQRVDKWRIIHHFRAFITCKDNRQITFGVGAETNGGAFRNVKIHVAFQVNRAGQINARRDNDFAAARLVTGVNRFAKRFGAIGDTITFRAVFGNGKCPVRKGGRDNVRQNIRQFRPGLGGHVVAVAFGSALCRKGKKATNGMTAQTIIRQNNNLVMVIGFSIEQSGACKLKTFAKRFE